jgi:transcription-repair coupling factor (superfamily II helicase)
LDGFLAQQTVFILTPTPVEAEDLALDLRFFRPNSEIVLLAPADLKPFVDHSISTFVAAERFRALYQLASPSPVVVVASLAAAIRLVPPPKWSSDSARWIIKGQEIDRDDLALFLSSSGYIHVDQVDSVGDYSIRGGLMDIYPPSFSRPVRVEFFGDFVESTRIFRVDDQRSLGTIDEVCLSPVSEIIINDSNGQKAASDLGKLAYESGWSRDQWWPIAERFRKNMIFDDLENWAPLFNDQGLSLNSYLGNARVVLLEPKKLSEKADELLASLNNHFQRLAEEGRPFLPWAKLFAEPASFLKSLNPKVFWEAQELFWAENEKAENIWRIPFETNADLVGLMSAPRRASGVLGPFVARVKALLGRDFKVNLVMRSQEQSNRLANLLAEENLAPTAASKGQAAGPAKGRSKPKTADQDLDEVGDSPPVRQKGQLKFLVGQLSAGLVAPFDQEAYIAEEEIFGSARGPRRRSSSSSRLLKGSLSLRDLKMYDYVVHCDYGIGHYLGLVTKTTTSGYEGEFLKIAYWGGDEIFVPVERFAAVTKYVGAREGQPEVDRLGTGAWEKTKAHVKEQIREKAEELLRLYAQRELVEGHSYSPPDAETRDFENSFEFVETPDQMRAIEDVFKDLSSKRPMDRLVCGDVGFGKTEVAARAAFKAVMDHKQVAILVPTTILAEQHERVFLERLKNWPINVASLSRFKKASEQRDIIEKLADGRLDILVGTHRILRPDVIFKDLGLLIIDEEHRFGVADKERLKKLRTNVDVLSMSATPIPRSLSMSMSGIRDMSIIETPPQERLAVKTFLIRRDDETIREAIDRELSRQGQVFFIHNRVKDIDSWISRLKKLLPLARFGLGHGQMKSAELERVTRAFYEREIDVWVATTIVESGLDLPAANTIIIDQADRFGLAQLYQLRGRVGRGSVQAYAYLMVDNPDVLTDDAVRRLKALLEHTDLGSGYQIAIHDLQIRGSGDILGSAQSGQANMVGFELYSQLLEQVTRELKNEPDEDFEPEVVIGLPAYIPSDYAPDSVARVNVYRRLTHAREPKEIEDMTAELLDRFGPLPQETQNLLAIMDLKTLLRPLRIRRLEAGDEGLSLTFRPEGPPNFQKILNLTQNVSGCRLSPSGRFFVKRTVYDVLDQPLAGIKAFVLNLG